MHPILKVLIPENIITVIKFLSSEDCKKYIELSKKMGYKAATITTSSGFQIRPEIRNNSRVIFDNLHGKNSIEANTGKPGNPVSASD